MHTYNVRYHSQKVLRKLNLKNFREFIIEMQKNQESSLIVKFSDYVVIYVERLEAYIVYGYQMPYMYKIGQSLKREKFGLGINFFLNPQKLYISIIFVELYRMYTSRRFQTVQRRCGLHPNPVIMVLRVSTGSNPKQSI